jgi:hypothetical protein
LTIMHEEYRGKKIKLAGAEKKRRVQGIYILEPDDISYIARAAALLIFSSFECPLNVKCGNLHFIKQAKKERRNS